MQEDVLENNFNILRMFVRIYGASAPTVLVSISFKHFLFLFILSPLPPFFLGQELRLNLRP